MSEKKKKINEFTLANNCPECYAQDAMVLTFYQKQVENNFFEKITTGIDHSIICGKCKQSIYPVKWTNDIERVYDFYYKTLEPKSSFKLTKTAIWLFILLGLLIIAGIALTPQLKL